LKRYGGDGTFYGDAGFDVITDVDLWPWPNEDIIKTAFRNDFGTTDETRGFCAESSGLYGGPITLTSYIWEYIGNPCPEEICNYECTAMTFNELIGNVNDWRLGNMQISILMEKINEWKEGCK